MQTIYLDISNRGVIPVIYAKQGDVGRKAEVVLTNSGLPYEPEAGSAFSAWFSGASGVGNYTDIGGHSAFSVSGNKVTVELITQMLQNAGEGILCLVLSRANGDQIGLWNIRYICEGIPGAGSEPAKDYYTAFSQAVAGLAYPDASLSVAGKAADAAATGKALEGKAPAGYVSAYFNCSTDSDIENALNSTYQQMSNGSVRFIHLSVQVGGLVLGGGVWTVQIHRVDGEYGSLMAESYGQKLQRVFMGGIWEPWECVNPSMVLGVEYRTTRRYNGKPVYARLIDLGQMPNNTAKSVTVNELYVDDVVEEIPVLSETAGSVASPYIASFITEYRYNKSGAFYYWITTNADARHWYGLSELWYTKK